MCFFRACHVSNNISDEEALTAKMRYMCAGNVCVDAHQQYMLSPIVSVALPVLMRSLCSTNMGNFCIALPQGSDHVFHRL